MLQRALAVLLVAGVGGLAIARSAAQLSAMSIFSTTARVARLEQASSLDPGSYRIHVRLVQGKGHSGLCVWLRRTGP